MRSVIFKSSTWALSFVVLASALLLADEGRPVRKQVTPVYPEIARKNSISGAVRLEVVIAPNGAVKSTKVLGGHPLLTDAAASAVKQWMFVTASAESTQIVVVNFRVN